MWGAMSLERIDKITEDALELQGLGLPDSNFMDRTLRRWPRAEGLEICFALTQAAAAVGRVFDQSAEGGQAQGQLYRAAALLAADVLALQRLGIPVPRAADILQFWAEEGT